MIVNVEDFKENGLHAIQSAIDSCDAGTVIIPNGTWHSGPIHLKSNLTLHLEDNATVIFSDNPDDYLPVVFTRWEGVECYNYSPLIYAKGCHDIAITGKGTLIGSGEAWWNWKQLQQATANELVSAEYNHIPVEKRIYGTREAALRPQFLQLIDCKEVLLQNLTIKDGPQWTIHPVYCENVVIQGVSVLTSGHNTDGINPDSCKDVLIENCKLSTGDDCIAINAGINEDGWRVNKPCENIEIRNCEMFGGHGAVVIGSAISGGVRNIHIHDCKIRDTMQGIRLKSMRGRGGYIENARFENIEIENVTQQAIQVTMFYEFSTVIPKSDKPSDFSGIEIKNVHGSSLKTGIQIKGLPEHKINDLTLKNITLTACNDAFTCSDVKNLHAMDIHVTVN